jgi:hypothetical protein
VSKPLCNFLRTPDTGFFASRFLYFLAEFVPSFIHICHSETQSQFVSICNGNFYSYSNKKDTKGYCVCVCVCVWRVEQIFKHVLLQFYCFHFFYAIHFVFVTDNFTLMLYSIPGLNLVSVHFYILYSFA